MKRLGVGLILFAAPAVSAQIRPGSARLPVTRDTAPKLAGCTFYESVLRETMQLLVGGVGAVEHVRCGSRGEGSCQWRAEWRAIR